MTIYFLGIREGTFTLKEAYEWKNDISIFLLRNPRLKSINDRVHNYFYFDKNRKSSSLQPKLLEKDIKENMNKNKNSNDYLTLQKDGSPKNHVKRSDIKKRTISSGAPSLLGVEKKQNFNTQSDTKTSKNIKTNHEKHRSIKQPPSLLDNISIQSPAWINGIASKQIACSLKSSFKLFNYSKYDKVLPIK